jgi:Spy/CpxP family protein refolding chaperone
MIGFGWRVIAATAVLCAISFGAMAQQADDPALVAAAKQEGKLTFYTSFLGAPFHLAVIKSFE